MAYGEILRFYPLLVFRWVLYSIFVTSRSIPKDDDTAEIRTLFSLVFTSILGQRLLYSMTNSRALFKARHHVRFNVLKKSGPRHSIRSVDAVMCTKKTEFAFQLKFSIFTELHDLNNGGDINYKYFRGVLRRTAARLPMPTNNHASSREGQFRRQFARYLHLTWCETPFSGPGCGLDGQRSFFSWPAIQSVNSCTLV